MANVIDQIVWPAPSLRDLTVWEQNIQLVKWLLDLAEVTEWIQQEGRGPYRNFPYFYKYQDVVVQFLPHWGIYSIGGINLPVPTTKEDLEVALEAVKQLVERGYHQKKLL